MNDILTTQNERRNIRRLAAQRQIYADAKRVAALQLALSTAIPLVSLVLVAFDNSLKAAASLAGFGVALLDVLVLDPWQKRLKGRAARVQEAFDCEVLDLPWNAFKAGSLPDPEEVAEAADRHLRKSGDSKLVNWYPAPVGAVPMQIARIICQRANCWWDAKLRRGYGAALIALFVAIVGAALLAATILRLSTDDLVLRLLAPLTPTVVWIVREFKRQTEAADGVDRVRAEVGKLWASVVATPSTPADELAAKAREFQDEIYDRRRTSPLVFDWVYALLKDRFEDQMNQGATDLVDEVTKK